MATSTLVNGNQYDVYPVDQNNLTENDDEPEQDICFTGIAGVL
jgi:hypothetical protein